ncbi:DUF6376 family protein [Ornithinibacillus salinisoli]|uniref:DUF6376 family protein n=1 Tax=Ornithinibacillus salinisoli TaxID=1848459 RepID=UPI00362D6DDD
MLEETNNTLNYVTETTEYFNELNNFAEETSTLISGKSTNNELQTELESKLTSLEETIKEYNTIEVPSIAEGIHQDITNKNEQLIEIINETQQNGEVAIDQFKESEIYQTIENLTSLKDQLEQLGVE